MGLFGGKDDTKAKIEELKAKMQGGQPGWQPPQQPWQPPQQQYQPPQQPWQPPEAQQPSPPPAPRREVRVERRDDFEELSSGIVLDLGDGMSLNLPIKGRMHLDEFLRIADRVRELKRIEHPQA